MTPDSPAADADKRPGGGASPVVLLVIAVALLVAYGVTIFVLFNLADDSGVDEPIWSRYIYLLGGLEAIVFTAVGWLFGREVNRKQAEQAEKATKDAADAKAKGEGLRQAILVTGDSGLESVDSGMSALRTRAEQTNFLS